MRGIVLNRKKLRGSARSGFDDRNAVLAIGVNSRLAIGVDLDAVTSVYADDLSALVTVKDKYLSALVYQVECDSGMIWGQLARNI